MIETLHFKRGSYLLPRIVLSGIIFFGLLLLVESFLRVDKAQPILQINWKPWGLIVVLTFIYIASIRYLGFYPPTVLYIFMVIFTAGVRKFLPLVLLPILFAGGIYLVFTVGFSIYLPGSALF